MFGSNILDTAIGLVLVFLLMSLICSALREIVESILKQRAFDLECGMRELLHDPSGNGLVRELYQHPLVYGLFTGEYTARKPTGYIARWFATGGKLPSYIPKTNFARALIDLYEQGKIKSPEMLTALRALGLEAGGDIGRLRVNIENWFDTSADRISGWYKRRTQVVLLVIGFIAALALNVNSITIANSLYKQSAVRAAVVATAPTITQPQPRTGADPSRSVRDNVDNLNKLAAAGLPMGWKSSKPTGWGILAALFGWLVTAVAVTLGAPFWFDLLNKFMSVRGTVKPRETAPVVVEASAEGTMPARPFTVAVRTKEVGDGNVVTAGVAVKAPKVEFSDSHESSDADH